MNAIIIVAIVFSSIIIILGMITGTILMAVKMRHGGVSRKSRQHHEEETRMIQEIYHGLTQMEKRVESLETILMENQEKDKPS